MIKMTVLLRRNPGLSLEEFRRHWRDVHGPLIRDTPSLARHVLRYEQHVGVGPEAGGFDGVALLWFASLQGFHDFLAEPAYREVLAPDERRLLDVEATQMAITDGDVTLIGATSGLDGD